MKTYILRTLAESKAPVWLNIVSAIIGGLVVWIGVPSVNQELEYQRLRSAFVTKTLDDLTTTTSEYAGYLAQITERPSGEPIPRETVGATARIATSLQWRAMELATLLQSKDDQALLEDYGKSLNALQSEIRKSSSEANQAAIEEATVVFMNNSFRLASRVTDVARMSSK